VSDILSGMADPLREPTFLILMALADAPMHGYGLIAEVDRLSEGRVSLRPGTLYGALDRLCDDGFAARDREEIVDGRLRRYYRLTEDGASALRAETERMRRHVEAATVRLRGLGTDGNTAMARLGGLGTDGSAAMARLRGFGVSGGVAGAGGAA
jgi:PadR family transcriptional regulator, regulatory protein PadR